MVIIHRSRRSHSGLEEGVGQGLEHGEVGADGLHDWQELLIVGELTPVVVPPLQL
jgi:hypothetical protein